MKRGLLVVFLILIKLSVFAQDPIYSQFYNAPNYLNPSLNGQFAGSLRVNFIHRSQWTSIYGPLNYSSFSVDYNVPKFGGGVGLLATRSSEGTTYLKRNTLAGIYSYSVDWDNAVLSFGVQAGLGNLKFDYNKAVFYDQLNENGPIASPTKAGLPSQNNRFYFDSGAGVNLVFFNAMIGGSVQHINKPNESFSGARSVLDMRINGHASYRFPLDYNDDVNGPALIPSVVYYRQYGRNSISTGLQYKTRRVNLGAWYRGESKQRDAFVFSISLDIFDRSDSYDKIRVGVSHDATASKLKYGETGGSTEGAVTWETTFPNSDAGERYNYGKRCYDFY
ncbi:PorP/SprF family type IX secretion system membrane protein [Desertivirga brevis]|uniref:PorP/SprF family type IX secretion system membrane protein n=1 Tax=Desertivirga brevis TaxID=2810310 RepID=UPI001A964BD1|nr:PorP/SprF family type IX secretion system membrane protein [Pedobacter sp. SYSU D00873]